MTSIRRQPPAYEQAMWPDTLPATITVPADFAWCVPADLDLSGTTLIVNGTVTLLPVPLGIASETKAGFVELATQAEVDAGTDTVRAVTPATLAARSVLSAFAFDGVTTVDVSGPGAWDRTITLTFELDGNPVSQRVGAAIAVTLPDESLPEFVVEAEPVTGMIFPVSTLGTVVWQREWRVISNSSGVCTFVLYTPDLSDPTSALLWVLLPDGSVASTEITLQGFIP